MADLVRVIIHALYYTVQMYTSVTEGRASAGWGQMLLRANRARLLHSNSITTAYRLRRCNKNVAIERAHPSFAPCTVREEDLGSGGPIVQWLQQFATTCSPWTRFLWPCVCHVCIRVAREEGHRLAAE